MNKHITDTSNGPAIEHMGKTYYLQQQAYADNSTADCGYSYFAHAVDASGEHGVLVAWDVLDDYIELCKSYDEYIYGKCKYCHEPQECDACDWDAYKVVYEYLA